MSPEAGEMLLHQIVPRIASSIPFAVPIVGCEDRMELLQDGTAMAAKILINATKNGKKVTPGNVAYYTLQHLKSGRRTVGYSSVDVLGSCTQLNGRSTVYSMHEEVPIDLETGEAVAVSDLMCREVEDPGTIASRHLDWQEFYATQDVEPRRLLGLVAEGFDVPEIARRLKSTKLAVQERLQDLRAALVEFFGASVLLDACRTPQWIDDIRSVKEQQTCRSERSWQTS